MLVVGIVVARELYSIYLSPDLGRCVQCIKINTYKYWNHMEFFSVYCEQYNPYI